MVVEAISESILLFRPTSTLTNAWCTWSSSLVFVIVNCFMDQVNIPSLCFDFSEDQNEKTFRTVWPVWIDETGCSGLTYRPLPVSDHWIWHTCFVIVFVLIPSLTLGNSWCCWNFLLSRTFWIDEIWVCWVYWWMVGEFVITLVQKSVNLTHFSHFYEF